MFSSNYSGHSLWKNTWHTDHTGENALSSMVGPCDMYHSLLKKLKIVSQWKGGGICSGHSKH